MSQLFLGLSNYFQDKKIKKIVISTDSDEYSWLLYKNKWFKYYKPVTNELVVHHRNRL